MFFKEFISYYMSKYVSVMCHGCFEYSLGVLRVLFTMPFESGSMVFLFLFMGVSILWGLPVC